jgi:hypothetical protein
LVGTADLLTLRAAPSDHIVDPRRRSRQFTGADTCSCEQR